LKTEAAELPLVLLFWGDDTERIEAAISDARARVLDADVGLEAFNHETFDAAFTEGFGPVLAACQQLPMMAARRLVELTSPENFGKHFKDAPPVDKSVDALLAYVQAPSPTTLLLLSSGGLRSTSRLVKAVTKSPHGRIERFKAPANDREAVAWLTSHARAHSIRLGRGAADELVRRVGHATAGLRSGVERARAHAGTDNVTLADVEAVVQFSREVDVFALTDAIGHQDHRRALELLAAMFSKESESDKVFSLLGLLTRHIRMLYTAAVSGTAALDVPPFIASKYDAQLRNFDAARLEVAFTGLCSIDAQLKGGTRARYVASKSALLTLQRWVLDTCGALPGTAPR